MRRMSCSPQKSSGMQHRQLARYLGQLAWRTSSILYFVTSALANEDAACCERDGRLGHGAGERVNLIPLICTHSPDTRAFFQVHIVGC